MDKGQEKANRWGWLPVAMPGVARMVAEYRTKLGDAHVNECWRRGVVLQEPGWFFAREGALTIGTPWGDWADVAFWTVTPTQAMVIIHDPEKVLHGAH